MGNKIIAVLATAKNYDWFMKNLPPARQDAILKAGYDFKHVNPELPRGHNGLRPVVYTHVLGHELNGYEQCSDYFMQKDALYVPHTKFLNLPTHVLLTIIGN